MVSYAKMLSEFSNKGTVGSVEIHDDTTAFRDGLEHLLQAWRTAKTVVIIAGAGISTAAGIPDFRGPQGVWTLEKAGKVCPDLHFDMAKPTYTHKVLRELERIGKIQKYYRDFVIESVGFKLTGRKCDGKPNGRPCRGELVDSTLDWEDELPKYEKEKSELYLDNADLVVCLGTSLQIVPVGDWPLRSKKHGGKVVTVNLQKTRLEDEVDIAIHGDIERVMENVALFFKLNEEGFSREEALLAVSIHPLESLKKTPGIIRKRKSKSLEDFEEDKSKIDVKTSVKPLVEPINTVETPSEPVIETLIEVETKSSEKLDEVFNCA